MRQRPGMDAAYCLAHHTLLNLLSFSTQERHPKDGTIHNELGPPTSITDQENALETCPQEDLVKRFS